MEKLGPLQKISFEKIENANLLPLPPLSPHRHRPGENTYVSLHSTKLLQQFVEQQLFCRPLPPRQGCEQKQPCPWCLTEGVWVIQS